MQLKTWYVLPIAAAVAVTALMIGSFDQSMRPLPAEPPVPETVQLDASPTLEQPLQADTDSAVTTAPATAEPADEASEQQELTAQLLEAGAKKYQGFVPQVHIMTSAPSVGSNITAPDNNVNQN